ncbi:DinB family protein [Terrabacter sp. 2RAF25]|uniref:DinB family protein n=1 Tax=Terrabacter sp. 2RAF25 TaxID=3232998 RepID=UPI003F975A8D
MTFSTTFAHDVIAQPAKAQLESFIDEHRTALRATLEGLSEEEVRRSLVPSATTLLGLVKHATYVEKVWFDHAVTGRSRAEIGIPEDSSESFRLTESDTVDSVSRAHHDACEASRRATESLALEDVLPGHRLGPLPLRWVFLHLLRELAQHCGHADILREQVLAARP